MLPRQFQGVRDVAILGPFVTGAEQDDNGVAAPAPQKIHFAPQTWLRPSGYAKAGAACPP